MNSTAADALAALAEHVDDVVGGLFGAGVMSFGDDSEVVAALTSVGRILRRIEAVAIDAVGEVARRSEKSDRDARLTTRFDCRTVLELVQRATLVGPQTAGRWQRGAKAIRRDTCPVSGELRPARFPAMRDALTEGYVGVDGLLAVTTPLTDLDRRAGLAAFLVADAELAAVARGEGADGAPPACADLLRVHATVWATVLDQDGSEPRERDALRHRGVHLGAPRPDGLVPIGGGLLPEVAAQFQSICDAISSPRVHGDTGGVRFRPDSESGDLPYRDGEFLLLDDRTPAQRRHDALATALFVAATSETLPTIGGAAPTLVVSVRQADLLNEHGWAHCDATPEPMPIGAAVHVGCAGAIQRIVLNDEGRIVRLGTEERLFNRRQRRAIALRDGGCIIPGCGVPPAWCEVHHVTDHAKGGPTHTDNGVLLCFFHHRFIDRHHWEIRINHGVPEIRAPRWIDSTTQWRPVTKSRIRLTDRIMTPTRNTRT